jgi:hypothetical protein
MLLPLSAAAIMATVLLWELALPRLRGSLPQFAHALAARRRAGRTTDRSRGPRFGQHGYDPGRELRAEQRARELLRSCVNEAEWAMYRDLGFLRVWAPTRGPAGSVRISSKRAGARPLADSAPDAGGEPDAEVPPGATNGEAALGAGARDGAPYAYLLYPHRPIVAYVPQTGALLNEYCVAFPDETRPYGSARLPDADDVLAKWMALAADERRLIADANMHLPGRQMDPRQVHEDLARLARWERERLERLRRAVRAPGSHGGWSSRPQAGWPKEGCPLEAGVSPLRSEASVSRLPSGPSLFI